ncbi:MaoC family dehydratase [Afipia sp. TerB]
MPYFEDIKIGDKREFGSFTFTADNIVAFARQFDPQPFHLDEEAGRKSIFKGLAASGWQVSAVCMKLLVAYFEREAKERAAQGEPPIVNGPSPGFRELKWLKPVLAGDTVTYTSEVVAMRPLASRPEWGLVNFFNTGVNQRGERVYSFIASGFVARKPA